MASSMRGQAPAHLGVAFVFRRETAQVRNSGRGAASRTITALAAAAGLAAMAAMAVATHASAAQEIKLENSSMDTTYKAYVNGEYVYSNGVTFTVQDYNNPGHAGATSGPQYDLFGFCVDIYHNITLGGLSLVYQTNESLTVTNPLPTNFGPTAPTNVVSPTQLTALTNLIDTGWLLHQNETAGNYNLTELELAAIQAAIWKVENPTATVVVDPGQASDKAGGTKTYNQLFTDYSNGVFDNAGGNLADGNDRFYTIVEVNPYDGHQSFGIGWPLPGVPEPTTWAMMLTGFFGMGSVLRRQRKVRGAVAA
jgi:hypothetical protein